MKTNKHLTKVVTGVVSASTLASSCIPNFGGNDCIYNVNPSNDDELGRMAIPISVELSEENVKYMAFLQKLSSDIIREPNIAKEFAKDPEKFAERYGYDAPISLDEGMLNLVLALGDEKINDAIKNNDIRLFYDLCKEKGLFKLDSNLKELINKEDAIKMLEKMGFNTSNKEEFTEAIFVNIPFICIAIAVLVAVVYAVAYDEIETEGSDKGKGKWKDSQMEALIADNPILNIWTLKNKYDKTFIVVDFIIEQQVDDIIEIIKEKSPTYFDRNSEDQVREMLKLNLSKKNI